MNKTPEIRFPEFEGLWLDTKLGELMDFRNGMNADKSRYGRGYKFVNVLDVIAEAPILDENIIGRVDADSDEVARFSLKSGDIVFQRSSETREDAGQANAYIGNGEALFGGFVIRGRPTVAFDVQYMAALLRTDNARKNTTNLAGGSTRFNVGQETLSSVQIQIAPTLLEQKKIAAFLSAVDDKLAAVEAQLAGWRDYKRGMMQALFSQTLRFKADDGADFPNWERKRLEELVSFIGGGTPSKAVPSYWKGELPWISSSDIFDDSITAVSISRGITERAVKESATKRIPKGSVLMVTRVGVGKLALAPTDLYASQDFTALSNLKIDGKFLAYQMLSKPNALFALEQGSTIKGIPLEVLKVLKIDAPSLPEQQKIVAALSAIDTKIKALADRLEATREFKRGLLQKMFV